jgi:CRISPR type IV-associated protein Csf2
VQLNGSVEEVPIISGNSIRGILRDRGMLHMLSALGYGVNRDTGEVQGLSLPAFYFLFSGGTLTKVSGRGLDIDDARRWRELIPLVALFGGAMGNQIMPGKVKIGKAIPICEETVHLLPDQFVDGQKLESVWELCQEEAYTRRDDEKSEKLRQLIGSEDRKLIEAKARGKRQKRGTGEDVRDSEQKQQMRYYVETIAAGTRLFWDVALDDVTDLEFEAFCVTLAEFARYPYIGGKSGVGHGKVSIHFDNWIEINPRIAPTGTDMSFALGNLYSTHLQENANAIKGLLDGFS